MVQLEKRPHQCALDRVSSLFPRPQAFCASEDVPKAASCHFPEASQPPVTASRSHAALGVCWPSLKSEDCLKMVLVWGLVSLWKPVSGGRWYFYNCRLSIRSCVTMVAKGNTGFKFHISVCSAWLRKQSSYGLGVGKGREGWWAGWGTPAAF